MLRVVVVGRTHSRSMSLAMLTMRKELHRFLFLLVHVIMLLRLVALRAAGVPVLPHYLHSVLARSSWRLPDPLDLYHFL